MADKSAMAEIRGLDVDKLAKGFADESLVLKRYVQNSKTSARQIRWYQKTSGFLTATPDTENVTSSQIANVSSLARPHVTEQSWTRQNSYVRKYFVESPWISDEDIKDSDVDLLATNVRDLVRAVANQVDKRIYDVLSEELSPSNIQSGTAVADGWDDEATGNPFLDIMEGKQAIRSYGYDPEGCILYINSIEHKNLINYIVNVKGSSVPAVAEEKLRSGVVMNLLGCNVVVSENATTDYALLFVPQRAATWKSFMPITSVVKPDPGIGKKIRVWEEGECLLTDPKSVYLIEDTVA